VGTGFSSLAVTGDRLYTLGNEDEKDTVFCLEAGSGKKVWSHSYPCGQGSYPGPRATPAADEESVYTLSREGHLFRLDARNGKVIWFRHLVRDFGVSPPQWDFAGSPVVEGESLVLNAGDSGLALDKATGKRLWGSPGRGGYATPVLARLSGKPATVLFGEDAVRGVELSRGTVLWTYPWQTGSDVNAADPLVAGDTVFIASAYGKGCALLDVAGQPRLLWKNQSFETHFSSFVLLDGFIYGIDGDARQPSAGTLRCLETRTGRETWSARLGFGSLIAAGRRLIVLTSTGTIVTVEADPSAYREIARGSLPRSQYWTPPAFSRAILYVRNLVGDVFAVDMR
jgi:outer membrane protein assembly factor BamB